jgi:hypothetical protein
MVMTMPITIIMTTGTTIIMTTVTTMTTTTTMITTTMVSTRMVAGMASTGLQLGTMSSFTVQQPTATGAQPQVHTRMGAPSPIRGRL